MSNDYSSLGSKSLELRALLRDQGISYGDYVEQITFLLFLKMDQERSELPERAVHHSRQVALGKAGAAFR